MLCVINKKREDFGDCSDVHMGLANVRDTLSQMILGQSVPAEEVGELKEMVLWGSDQSLFEVRAVVLLCFLSCLLFAAGSEERCVCGPSDGRRYAAICYALSK